MNRPIQIRSVPPRGGVVSTLRDRNGWSVVRFGMSTLFTSRPAGRSSPRQTRGLRPSPGRTSIRITQRFSTEMEFEYRALVESSVPSSDLFPQFLDIASYILNGKVIREGGILFFQSNADGRKLPFQLLSSGDTGTSSAIKSVGKSRVRYINKPTSGGGHVEPPFRERYLWRNRSRASFPRHSTT